MSLFQISTSEYCNYQTQNSRNMGMHMTGGNKKKLFITKDEVICVCCFKLPNLS